MPGAAHVNDARADSFSQVDVRVSKDFRFGGAYGVELIGEMFNALNSDNPQKYDNLGVPTAYAGTEPTVAEQRLIQLGVRVHF